jgi:methionyl-tRNA formyltransferase
MSTPDFGVPVLTALNDCHDVVGVFTRPDRPAGRGRHETSSPVKEAASRLGIPVYEPRTMRSEESARVLAAMNVDAVVVASFAYLLPPGILATPPHGCLNVHPSLLPRHRGPSPVAGAILAGDARTGASIMLMDEGLDTGPVLGRRSIELEDCHTTGTLTGLLSELGAQLLLPTLEAWIAGEVQPEPQDETKATYTSRISARDGLIDWSMPAVDIWRRVRAFDPWPGCYTSWGGRRLKVRGAVPLDLQREAEPGTVVSTPSGTPVPVGVVTGDGLLGLSALQLEGKREVPADEFLRGQRNFVGAVLSE